MRDCQSFNFWARISWLAALLSFMGARAADPDRTALDSAIEPIEDASAILQSHLRWATHHFDNQAFSLARQHWEMALASSRLSELEQTEILLKIGCTEVEETNEAGVLKIVQEILTRPSSQSEDRAQAQILLGRLYSNFGSDSAWNRAREACEGALRLERLSTSTRTQICTLLAPAYFALRRYSEASTQFQTLASDPTLPALFRAQSQLSVARSLWLQQQFASAREAIPLAHDLLLQAAPDSATDSTRAELQLLEGVTFYDESRFAEATEHLQKVLTLPGQTPQSSQSREAILRLRLRHLIPEPNPSLKVLFIGSSHTIRGNIPLLVECLAASSLDHRISAGEHSRMGTGLRAHWIQGQSPDTARGRILAEHWDFVVVETFYASPREDLLKFVSLYSQLVHQHGARLILYESPAARAIAYPSAFEHFHQSNLWLAQRFKLPLAPSVDAWMRILGPHPSNSDFQTLYADWIHATPNGAYLTACCLYSALTNSSPESLFAPEHIPVPQAHLYQQAAWNAYLATRSLP